MKDNGGPAFPRAGWLNVNNGAIDWPESGMSLRDWFAGLAMLGMYAINFSSSMPGRGYELAAEQAYKTADAMLAEREKGETK